MKRSSVEIEYGNSRGSYTMYFVESQCGVRAGSKTENYERLEKVLEEYLDGRRNSKD